jgi:hypothetical protein
MAILSDKGQPNVATAMYAFCHFFSDTNKATSQRAFGLAIFFGEEY